MLNLKDMPIVLFRQINKYHLKKIIVNCLTEEQQHASKEERLDHHLLGRMMIKNTKPHDIVIFSSPYILI
jgi:hypothetical protein